MDIFSNCNVIWDKEENANQWVCFRWKTGLLKNGKRVLLRIAVESKYVLYLNGQMLVFDGGLNRGPDLNSGYYDEIDLTDNIRDGQNTFAVIVWYWGNGGRCNYNSGFAGLMFEIKQDGEMVFNSSEGSVKVKTHPCYLKSRPPLPSYLYGGDNITYRRDPVMDKWYMPDFDDLEWQAPVTKAKYPQTPWGILEKRPIPQFYFTGVKKYGKIIQDGEYYYCFLNGAKHISPYMKLYSPKSGINIDIRTDRYEVNGGPGDHGNVYRSQRIDYVADAGEQDYLALYWYFGEQVIYKIPNDITVLELGYMESGYDCQVTLDYSPKTEFEEKLVGKCLNTLRVCMRDNFMDCPDRERGQWIGDVSVQAPQVFRVLDSNAVMLVKKAIDDFIRMRNGAVLRGNVPGECASELPSQSLIAIGQYGMISEYVKSTGDIETLKRCYAPMLDYLKLWNLQPNGLVEPRTGDWAWFDHLENVDSKVLENCIYLSAVQFVKEAAEKIGRFGDIEFLRKRAEVICSAVRKHYRCDNCYKGGEYTDERANAFAVLSGVADKKEYPFIRDILIDNFNCTPYMEYFVLLALCKMGYKEEAYQRMVKRYSPLVENENSTLWEDFEILGTRNHAWSGGALTVLLDFFI